MMPKPEVPEQEPVVGFARMLFAEAGAEGVVPDSDCPKSKSISWDASSGTIDVGKEVATGR